MERIDGTDDGMAIYFDMDGTLADLYGQEDWLARLRSEDASPYEDARPMFDVDRLAGTIADLRGRGFHVGVVTWLPKGGGAAYSRRVAKAKLDWCRRFLPRLDEIAIVAYGTPKASVVSHGTDSILVDDEERNLEAWADRGSRRSGIDASNRDTMFAALDMLAAGHCLDCG